MQPFIVLMRWQIQRESFSWGLAWRKFAKLKLKRLETLDLKHAFEYEYGNLEKIQKIQVLLGN